MKLIIVQTALIRILFFRFRVSKLWILNFFSRFAVAHDEDDDDVSEIEWRRNQNLVEDSPEKVQKKRGRKKKNAVAEALGKEGKEVITGWRKT